MTSPENTQHPTPAQRPIGYWLRVVDRKLDDAMLELFADEGITRRDWRRLNVIAGTVDDARLRDKIAAHPDRLAPLVERGWVTDEPDAPRLTEEGEASYAALLERVTALRSRVAGSVTPEDFQTTLDSLEAIARELGWSEGERMPRHHRRGEKHRGRGHEHGHGHGHHEHGHEHGHHGHGHRGHGHRDFNGHPHEHHQHPRHEHHHRPARGDLGHGAPCAHPQRFADHQGPCR
ncbi:MarR family winged helix-turn-helix transcriptional regulator [Agromyces lapidis]|uniref:MarR family winged helix-turn-helix transcriptional regulator n=1 Tax=Agromyces lapidis TaxID=279574 RepID=A0ABV5SN68_9MICO|nr:hypothetical protein [Agromyces lapidis]